jgi:hypothetical protein
MASGHMNRVKRPDTWLHRPMLQNVKKVLANPEPSTHDPLQISLASQHFTWVSVLSTINTGDARRPRRNYYFGYRC